MKEESMRSLNRGLLCMAGFLLALGFSSVALAQGGSGASAQAISQTVAAESGGPDAVLASAELPDSPGAIQAQSQPQTSTAQQNTSTAPANAGQDQRPQRPE